MENNELSLDEQFEHALNYAIATRPTEEVIQMLIDCFWKYRKKVNAPLLQMTKFKKDGKE